MVTDEIRCARDCSPGADVRNTLAELLGRNGAMNAPALARIARLPVSDVHEAMNHLADCGTVEVLRPIRATSGTRIDPELEYYRRKLDSDDDHAWQAMLIRKEPPPPQVLERRFAFLVGS